MNHKLLVLFCAILLSFISCIRDEESSIEKLNPASVDVYVAGMENNNACYWKNGVKTDLTIGTGITASKIIVENNDVYVAAKDPNTAFYKSMWINNMKYDIKNYVNLGSSYLLEIHDFYVKNGDIYFTGRHLLNQNSQQLEFCMWKNGIKTVLSNFVDLDRSGITVYQGNTYVTASFYQQSNNTSINGYFENTTFHALNQVYFENIVSNDNRLDLFNYNSSYNIPTNTFTNVNYTSTFFTELKGAALDGNDLYIFQKQFYFKNNIEYAIVDPFYKYIDDMKVKNSNIFMIRDNYNSSTNLVPDYKVFLNNVETQYINGSNGTFNSIFVVQN